tara:strand:+ start:734 stop:1309 length:576 start_codon:yes stop_codon:yes gene_type:complete
VVIEGITFKLALDFFVFLKKNRITSTGIKIDFFNNAKHQFIDFVDVAAMQTYYDSNYIPLNGSGTGDLVSISVFSSTSDLYDFITTFVASDVTGNLKLKSGSSFDSQRDSGRKVYINRQSLLIKNAVADYVKYYKELNSIYKTGIYSSLYAVPGWSQGTWYLNSFREALNSPRSVSEFPFTDEKIEQDPPS